MGNVQHYAEKEEPVLTKFQFKIKEICTERNDEWFSQVYSRISTVLDLSIPSDMYCQF